MALATLLWGPPPLTAQDAPPRDGNARSLPDPLRTPGPGVSMALARARRAQVGAVRYALALAVSAGDTAHGTVTVGFTRRGPGPVVLDFRGLSVGTVSVNGRPLSGGPGSVWDGAHLQLPADALRPGDNTATVSFASRVAAAGAAVIRTVDATDGRPFLYTLLVPSDAHLLFPVFDQPDLKARVTLTLTTPAGWRALANGALQGMDTVDGGVRHRFATTAPISSYLIAFAAGPWQVASRPEVIRPGEAPVPVELWMRPSRAAEVAADSLIALNARALRWLGAWFGVPYPFGKYALLLAPAFPFGGMEHPGAVFYNEDSFSDREPPTLPQRLGRQATTYHEVAHQWFGDYVTMRWFDDLWLKEGFATYMAARMQAEVEPEAEAWKGFYLRNKPTAYATDATAGTTPVWQQLGNLDQAKSNYGPIVYNKAPALLRQLEFLVGPTAFQRGVRSFLRAHAFGNATWQALLTHVGAAAGRDLAPWGRQWFLRPGMPVVTQQLTVRDGRIARLALTQRPAQPGVSGPGGWPQKMEVLLYRAGGPSERLAVELRGDTTEVAAARGRPAPDFVFANHGDHGYALVLPDSASVRWLETGATTITDPFLRAMVWGALWDLVREAQLDPARLARMALAALPQERDEQLAAVLVSRVVTTTTRYVTGTPREALLGMTERALLAGASDTTRGYGIRKAHLDGLVAVAESPGALARLDGWLDSTSAAGLPLRGPTRWALVTRLMARGVPGAEERLAAERARDRSADAARLAFVAEAARPDSAWKGALFARWFSDAGVNEEWVTASLRAFHDPARASWTAPLLPAALDSLPWIQRNRRIFFLGNWLGATLGGQVRPEALATVDRWLAERPALAPDLRQKVLQARDELERTVRIRGAWGGGAVGRSEPPDE
ncbi:MAG: ERAP1-like C-terminal domain-containing protein [Gemmatimonadetes bacterium]|nr:ERAP1-like C-terminal domain-containing protein [Gemmatimonadota bacterium]